MRTSSLVGAWAVMTLLIFLALGWFFSIVNSIHIPSVPQF